MSANGNRVTTKQFYEKLGAVEEKITRRLDILLEGQTRVDTIVQAHEKRLDKHESDIESLERSDRRWAGISGLIAAIAGAIAGWWGRG